MRRYTTTRRVMIGAFLPLVLGAAFFIVSDSPRLSPAFATQPGPPVSHTLTVNTRGGNEDCWVKIVSPAPGTPFAHTSFTRSYPHGTRCEVDVHVNCPCGYVFTHWESNNEELNGLSGNRAFDFDLLDNTTATAVFVPRMGRLIAYVEDPTYNSPAPYDGGGIGHAFWEFKGDCLTPWLQLRANEPWGFYPAGATYGENSFGKKVWLLTNGRVGEDGHRQPTHRRSYYLSYNQLEAGTDFTNFVIFNPPFYHAEDYNCTDALIDAAAAAGASLPSAFGSYWPYFSGNCPGALGERLQP